MRVWIKLWIKTEILKYEIREKHFYHNNTNIAIYFLYILNHMSNLAKFRNYKNIRRFKRDCTHKKQFFLQN